MTKKIRQEDNTMMNETEIQERFNTITSILSKEFNNTWINEIVLKTHDDGNTFVYKNGLVVHLSMKKLQIAMEDGAFQEYKIVLERINVAYHVLRKQGRYIITDDPLTFALLHELSYILAYQANSDIEPHGKEFCAMYDTLIYYIRPHVIWPFNRNENNG